MCLDIEKKNTHKFSHLYRSYPLIDSSNNRQFHTNFILESLPDLPSSLRYLKEENRVKSE
ncbi:hypothetical protein Hanom_Chr04g00367171 [Helianthus anomalus]